MKMKTSELTGAALDWAVAKCEDTITADGYFLVDQMRRPHPAFYSTDWAQGGPIIERELCELVKCKSGDKVWWEAISGLENTPSHAIATGTTPLIAAMRCCVASKLGDEVEIPEELK